MSFEERRNPSSTQSRFRPVPIRYLLPNLVTLLALCAGVTAIRFGVEGRYELAVGGIIAAMCLDAIDGRLARYLQGTSRFGAELDSLADFVNFGVAPAILLYFFSLNQLKTFGWVICLMLAICCALRLARFNVMLEDMNKPEWMSKFFSGVPAPAGAGLVLTPFYFSFLDRSAHAADYPIPIAIFTMLIAVLMVSRLPTFSGKSVQRIPREMVLPSLALASFYLICLIAFPWETLIVSTGLYLLTLPWGFYEYLKHKKADDLPKE